MRNPLLGLDIEFPHHAQYDGESMDAARNFFLSEILGHPVHHYEGHRVGVLADVVAREQPKDYGRLLGLVVAVGSIGVFVPATGLTALTPERVELAYSTIELGEYSRSSNEVLLVQDVLDHSLVDHKRGGSAIVHDVQLTQTLDGWACTGLDVRRPGRLMSSGRNGFIRDWRDFEPLTFADDLAGA